jgi:hypothetical protein
MVPLKKVDRRLTINRTNATSAGTAFGLSADKEICAERMFMLPASSVLFDPSGVFAN